MKINSVFTSQYYGIKTIGILLIVLVVKKNESTNTYINVHIKNNYISNIASNIGRYIFDKDYGETYTIEEN